MWQGHFILAMPSLMLWKTVLQDGKEMPYMLAMISVVSLDLETDFLNLQNHIFISAAII